MYVIDQGVEVFKLGPSFFTIAVLHPTFFTTRHFLYLMSEGYFFFFNTVKMQG